MVSSEAAGGVGSERKGTALSNVQAWALTGQARPSVTLARA